MAWYDWFFDCVKNKFFMLDGRARRSEYWFYTLFYVILSIIANILMQIPLLGMIISVIWLLITIILIPPSIAVTVRRLHDTGRSGWWALLALIPFVNLILLVFLVLDSEPGSNEYGDNPKC